MQRVLLVILITGVLLSALGVVYAKHQSRKLFVELQTLSGQRDHWNVEWSKLLLELNTWGSHDRIEYLAREQLHMTIPPADKVIFVTP